VKIFIATYVVSLLVLLASDAVWLSFMGKSFYQHHMGELLGAQFIWWAAALFYLIYSLGLTTLVTYPLILSTGCPMRALWMGALFGLSAYGAYNFTNLATLKKWPIVLVVVDMLWGMTVTGTTAFSTFLIIKHLLKLA